MKKGILIGTLFCLALAMSFVSAASEHSDNSIAIIFHWITMLAVILVVVFVFMASGMFAGDLGKAMHFVGWGMVLVVINGVMEELAHLEMFVIPEGTLHSLTYHAVSGIGFILIAYGFYRIYSVAKGVSAGNKGRK